MYVIEELGARVWKAASGMYMKTLKQGQMLTSRPKFRRVLGN